MSDVVSIRPPNIDIVETLKDLLKRAKAGDFESFCFASVSNRGTMVTGWAFDTTNDRNSLRLIGAASRLAFKLNSQCSDVE